MFDIPVNRRLFLLRSAATIGLSRTSSALAQDTASVSHEMVGAWWVETQGAPFPVHLMTFHADGTLIATGPDAGDPGASDSDGMGVWRTVENQVAGAFEEAVADRSTHQWLARVRIEFEVTVDAHAFRGPAHATISAPDGTVLRRSEVFFTATRIHHE